MIRKRNILLYPFSLIYGFVSGIRNFLYNSGILRSVEFRTPIICVGNITVGGTGKTPHTEYITDLLRQNFKVATLSRGYKRKSKGFIIATPSSNASETGDEPRQISLKFKDVLVAVDKNRVEGVKKILEIQPDTDVIILDDGFQHRKLKPGFSILLTDYSRLMIHDSLLPYGNLREGVHNMARADMILVTKSPPCLNPIERRIMVKDIGKAPYQHLYFTSLNYAAPERVFYDAAGNDINPLSENNKTAGAVLVTGIADPSPLREYLEKHVSELKHLVFPDHYNFRENDLDRIWEAYLGLKSSSRYIFTTEKDAVRLREFSNIAEPFRSSFFYIPIGIYFQNNDREEFDNIITNYVRKNRGNHQIP